MPVVEPFQLVITMRADALQGTALLLEKRSVASPRPNPMVEFESRFNGPSCCSRLLKRRLPPSANSPLFTTKGSEGWLVTTISPETRMPLLNNAPEERA